MIKINELNKYKLIGKIRENHMNGRQIERYDKRQISGNLTIEILPRKKYDNFYRSLRKFIYVFYKILNIFSSNIALGNKTNFQNRKIRIQ